MNEDLHHVLRNKLAAFQIACRACKKANKEIWDALEADAGRDLKTPEAQLVRIEKGPEGQLGLFLRRGRILCFTLEHPTKAVTPGVYECVRVQSPKFGETFEITAPPRSAIRFHWGNTQEDTEGCPLLGQRIGEINGWRAVLDSKIAFTWWLNEWAGVDRFTLDIMDL